MAGTPPGIPVLAAYMTPENHGAQMRRLVAVHSPDVERIEIHTTVVRDGVASMIARDSLDIAAGGRTVLAPGGYHLMLYGPRRALTAGTHLALELGFDAGPPVSAVATVRRAGPAMMHRH